MDLNSIEDVKALNEYKKIEQIQRIEQKFHRLGLVPYITFFGLVAYAFFSLWVGGGSWSYMHFMLIATSIASVGYSNVERTDLLKQLIELKYGN
ncbi:MAG: hypothetical protein HWE26_14455 [Alteromonadaceae bacterium]|nr:hypothetical protein [Alteromonadaceae bacterium]